MRRIWLRILGGVVVLIVVVIVAVQAVLWSSLPKQIVTSRLEQTLGLAVHIRSVSVGWWGHTTARGVTVGLPMAGKPLVEIPKILIVHASLLKLAVLGQIDLSSIRADRIMLHLRQMPNGDWNLLRAIRIVEANRSPPAHHMVGPIPLPAVRVKHLMLRVKRLHRSTALVADASIRGKNVANLGYDLTVSSPTLGKISARVARSRPFAHRVSFSLSPAASTLRAVLGQAMGAVVVDGVWTGQMRGQRLSGALALSRATTAWGKASGTVALSIGGGRVSVQPMGLKLSDRLWQALAGCCSAKGHMPTLNGGQLIYDLGQHALHLDHVTASVLGGAAELDGVVQLPGQTGQAALSWRGVRVKGMSQGGSFDVRLSRSLGGQRAIHATLATRGSGPGVQWHGKFVAEAKGGSWTALSGQLQTQAFSLIRGGKRFDLPQLVVPFSVRRPTVKIADVHLARGPGSVQASGALNWQTRQWSGRFDVRQVSLPYLGEISRLTGGAHGSGAAFYLTQGRLAIGDLSLAANGSYVKGRAVPVDLHVKLKRIPFSYARNHQPIIATDHLAGALEVTGRVSPRDLAASGTLTAVDLRLHHDNLGNVRLKVHAHMNARRLTVVAKKIHLFGGQWQLQGDYQFPAGHEPALVRGFVGASEVDLHRAAQLLPSLGDVSGQGGVSLFVQSRSLNLADVQVRGTFHAEHVAKGLIKIDALSGELLAANDQLRLDHIQASRGSGRLRAALAMNLKKPGQVQVQAELGDWPTSLPKTIAAFGLSASADAEWQGQVNVADRRGDGRGLVALRLQRDGVRLADVRMATVWQGHDLTLKPLGGQVLGGSLHGQVSVDVTNLSRSVRADIGWQGIGPKQLAEFARPWGQVQGALAGSVRVGPASSARALGPMRVEVSLKGTHVGVGRIKLTGGNAVAFFGDGRYVLEKLNLDAAGGHLNLWGRISKHVGQQYLFARCAAKNLDIGDIVRTVLPKHAPVTGKLDIRAISLTTPLSNWKKASGRGWVAVRKSDFANVPLFSAIFQVLNFSGTNTGRGIANFRLDNSNLIINPINYDRTGLHLHLAGTVDGVWKGPKAMIRAIAFASQSPLPQIEAFSFVNQALGWLQTNVTTVEIVGPIGGPPKAKIIPLKGLQDTLGQLFGAATAPLKPSNGAAGSLSGSGGSSTH